MSEFLFRIREPLSAALSLLLMLFLVSMSRSVSLTSNKQRIAESSPIEFTFVGMTEVQRLSIPEVQQPASTTPPMPQRQNAPTVLVHAPAVATTTATGLANASQVKLPPDQKVQSAIEPSSGVIATPPISTDSVRDAEALYIGKIRAHLQSIKRYPTGREASQQRPTGAATIWFVMLRSGELLEAGIQTSSGSMLLDNAALVTVRRGLYPSFPDEAWAGKAQHRFSVELDFIPTN